MNFFAVKDYKVLSNNQQLNQYLSKKICSLLTGLLEALIEEEFCIFLDRKRYARLKGMKTSHEYRNGYRTKYYLTIYSMMLQLRIPRCRGKSFKPILFRNKSILDPELETMLIQLWSDGSSYRDIQNFVKRIYGSQLSLGLMSRMIGKIDNYLGQYHDRKLSHEYEAIYIDGLEICIKEFPPREMHEYRHRQKIGKNAVVLGVLGQRREGMKIIREIIDYRIVGSENTEDYTKLLGSLRSRGLSPEKIGIMVHDGLSSISAAIKNIYGRENVPQQECMFHKMLNILKTVENKFDEPEIRKDIWGVYNSCTIKEYEAKKEQLYKKWVKKEPAAVKLFYSSDERLKTKYDFDIMLHTAIHTNNPIERYFRELRRRIKAIGIFESKISADRLLFLMVESINQRRGSAASFSQLLFTH